jgi:RHS repeat-associated protein
MMLPYSVRFTLLCSTLLMLSAAPIAAQVGGTGGAESQAQQQPCLPEDEPCGGGGGSGFVAVSPDDVNTSAFTGSTGNITDFVVHNGYENGYNFSLSCTASSGLTCTAIKNPAGTTVSSIFLAAGGSMEIMVHYSASATPGVRTLRLIATNGITTDTGFYTVTVSAPPTPSAVSATFFNHNRDGIDRGLCFTAGAGAGAGTSCGDLFIAHGMPAYRTMGRDRSLSLLYNSAAARGQALLAAYVTQPAGSVTPTKLIAVLQVAGFRDSAEYGGIAAGTTAQIVLGDRLAVDTLPTGVYPISLLLRNINPGVHDAVLYDTIVVVNQRRSEYGRGWGLVGVERLLRGQPAGTDDILWVGGDGSALRYRKVAVDTWVAPAADFRDVITYYSDSARFIRRLRHNVQVIYNDDASVKRHIQTINRYGQVTRFVYDTVSSVIRLKEIRMPGNDLATRAYRLFWSAAPARLLDSIRDPGGRRLGLTRSGSAVTAFTDPDGQQTQFVYGGPDSLLSARRIPNPVISGGWAQTNYTYTGRSKLARMRSPAGPTGLDSTVIVYSAWQRHGLDTLASLLAAPPTVPTSPVTGFASTVDGPIAGTGDRYSAWVNRFGAPTRTSLEGTGAVTRIFRDSTTMPALVTQVEMPNGRRILLRYNARGNLVMQRDSTWHIDTMPTNFSTWTYGNASFPDSPTQVADALGRTTTTVLHSTFGVPVSVTAPNGHQTTFSFLGNGLLQSVTEEDVETWIQGTQSEVPMDQATAFEYDGMGQVRKTTAPSGAVTVWQGDSLGRVIAAWDPVNTRSQFTYDVLNRIRTQSVDRDSTANPLSALSVCRPAEFTCNVASVPWPAGTPASFVTTSHYGQVGLDSVVAPLGVPRAFRYDASMAMVREIDHDTTVSERVFLGGDGLVDSTERRTRIGEQFVDPAGSGAGARVRYSYDSVGRLTRMSYFQVITGISGGAQGPLNNILDTIPGDSVVYQYDLEGRLLQTRSLHPGGGTVSRTYWANGLLRSRVTNKPFLDSLTYWYDITGVVVRKAHASYAFGAVMRDTVDYSYSPATGSLTAMQIRVTTPTGVPQQIVSFSWDGLGRRRQVIYPGSKSVNYRYDAGGNLRQLWTEGSSGSLSDNFWVRVKRDSVDLTGRVFYERIDCTGIPHDGRACGSEPIRQQWNRYYRNGWLATQQDGLRRDTVEYNASGSISRRWREDDDTWHAFEYAPRTNRVIRDTLEHLGSSGGGVLYMTYNADGSRRSEGVPHASSWQYLLRRVYRYDALGRLRGFGAGQNHEGDNFNVFYAMDACQYDPEGRMVRACGAPAKVTYDGENVVAADDAQWHFYHGPGVDDALIGIGRRHPTGPVHVLYWVTDGMGGEYGVSLANGTWNSDFDAGVVGGGQGWQQAGGIRAGGTFDEARQGNGNAPRLAFFRNRVYDMQTGQWTQEDPLGLAGGVNLYQYSGNNPVMFNDPFGLSPDTIRASSAVVKMLQHCAGETTTCNDVVQGLHADPRDVFVQVGSVTQDNPNMPNPGRTDLNPGNGPGGLGSVTITLDPSRIHGFSQAANLPTTLNDVIVHEGGHALGSLLFSYVGVISSSYWCDERCARTYENAHRAEMGEPRRPQ